MSNYEALKALLIAQNEDCLLALESAAADLIVGMTAELSVLKDEIAWCSGSALRRQKFLVG